MIAEDALVAIGEESRPKGKESVREDQRGCKRERNDHQTSSNGNNRRDDKIPWTVKFTPNSVDSKIHSFSDTCRQNFSTN